MRTARKTRQIKTASATISNTSSCIATVEGAEGFEAFRTRAGHGGRKLPLGIDRVPTHVVTVPNERRAYPRASLRLPLRIVRVAGSRESRLGRLLTLDISSSGLRTRCPFEIELGVPVNLEVELVHRPAGRGSVRLITEARVVRTHADARHGWHALAFCFDEITFERDEFLPPHFARG